MLTRTTPRQHSLRGLSPHGFHRVVWHEWGAADNPRVVVCVHSLTRTGRDFDVLGEALAPTHRVLAIDLPGRGRSDWLAEKRDYGFPLYLSTLTALVAAARVETVDWIGTSLGGLLGIVMAGLPGSPVTRLIVNDVGPAIEPAGLARIGAYVGLDPLFATRDAIAAYVRSISPFGPLTEAQWAHVVDTVVAQRDDGQWGLIYDPGIAIPFREAAAPVDLWSTWDAIRCPTLLLRGADSDLLSAETAREMTRRGPRPRLVELEGVAHAPTFFADDLVATVVGFLR